MYWCIYRITNKINGKTYIGQHKTKSILKEDGYMGSGKLLKKAKNKYGIENFEKTYITIAMSQSEANVLEQFYIAEERAKGKAEYNIANGACGGALFTGHKHSEEAKKKISEAAKGRIGYMLGKKHSEETKQKNRDSHLGKKHSEETKQKMSEMRKGHRGWNKGKHWPEETIKKRSEAMKGKHWYNNGVKEILAHECPEGFHVGRI